MGLCVRVFLFFTFAVAIHHCVAQLFEIDTAVCFAQFSFLDDFIKQFAPGDQFQHDKDLGLAGQYFDQFHHVRVFHHFHDGDFFFNL